MFQFFAVCGEGEAALSTQQYVIGKERDGAEKPARLLYVTHAFYSEEWNSSLHTHTCAELFFITGGHGAFQVQQDRFPVAINDLVVINTSVPHAETSQNGSPMEYVVLGVEGLEPLTGIGGYALMHLLGEQEMVSTCLRLMVQEARDRGVLIDASYGRRTRAVLIMDSGHVILSALQTETIAGRLGVREQGNAPEEEEP